MEDTCKKAGESRLLSWHRSCFGCHSPHDALKDGKTGLHCTNCGASPADGQIEVQFILIGADRKRTALEEASRAAGANRIRIAVLARSDGLVHFEFDLWRTPWDLRPEIREKLRKLWNSQVAQYRAKTRTRRTLKGTIGKTYSTFDVPSEFSEDWQSLLTAVLSTGTGLEKIS